MQRLLIVFLLFLGAAASRADTPFVISPGIEQEGIRYVYGWSPPEGGRTEPPIRWISGMEGELRFELPAPAARFVKIEAMGLVVDRRIQNMGLFVNGHFAGEWLLDNGGAFREYLAETPAAWWKTNDNRLVIRAGFKHSPEGDPRDLSIAVRAITLNRSAP